MKCVKGLVVHCKYFNHHLMNAATVAKVWLDAKLQSTAVRPSFVSNLSSSVQETKSLSAAPKLCGLRWLSIIRLLLAPLSCFNYFVRYEFQTWLFGYILQRFVERCFFLVFCCFKGRQGVINKGDSVACSTPALCNQLAHLRPVFFLSRVRQERGAFFQALQLWTFPPISVFSSEITQVIHCGYFILLCSNSSVG